jgi:phage virion morphogenesis protein
MSGVRLDYKIDDREILRALKRMDDFNATEMFEEIGAYLDSAVLQRFEDGAGPDGIKWEESERAKNEAGKTLIDFGHLRDSITHIASSTGVEHGSNMIYAAIHQFGGKTGRNKSVTMIARPFIGLNADDEDEINAIVRDFVSEVMP